MIRRALFFVDSRHVEVRDEELADPGPGEVLVETMVSGISAGSEMLVYRGHAPQNMAADLTIPALAGGHLTFPLKYGYSVVGRVNRLGTQVDPAWKGRLVFSFQPHQSHFVVQTSDVSPLPEGLTPDEAVFLPNIETAINLVMDGRPLIDENVVLIGQGVVGLLTTALLSRFPLGRLVTVDPYLYRRGLSKTLGAQESLDPADSNASERLGTLLQANNGADLVYELSGNPEAVNMAIGACGFGGRVVIGSWYGRKEGIVDLGGKFHRDRIKLISSQVSTMAPELTGRWTKARRLQAAWSWLSEIGPARFITRRFPLDQAGDAYRLLDEDPSQDLQVVLTYGNEYG